MKKKSERKSPITKMLEGLPNPAALRVCVIGAGSSGLVTAKELRDESHDVVCFERAGSEGGLFSAGPRSANDKIAIAYDGLSLNVSNHFMAFSSMPSGDSARRYWSHREYGRYLNRFACEHGLRDLIVFNAEVRDVRQRTDGKWEVDVDVGGSLRTDVFDAVAVCTGRYDTPYIPDIEGLSTFTGDVCHSAAYRDAARYRGKRVVCVGLGESGAAICNQLSIVAASTTAVARRPPHITHRNLLPHTGKDDTHDAMFSPFVGALEAYRYGEKHVRTLLAEQAHSFLGKAIAHLKDPEARLVREWEDMGGGFPGGMLVNQDAFLKHVVDGRVDVNLFGVARVENGRVVCNDGTAVDADAIILCTGYRDSFEFLRDPRIRAIEQNPRKLFKHMFHPEIGPSLAFIGLARPIAGGVPAIAELQARYFARVCSEKCRLPDEDMDRQIREDERAEETYFYVQRDLKCLVVLAEYTKWLAREIGCLPRARFWLLHPRLWMKYRFTPTTAHFFRLVGPGSLRREAAQAIMRQRCPMGAAGVVAMLLMSVALRIRSFIDRKRSYSISAAILEKQAKRKPFAEFLRENVRKHVPHESHVLRLACETRVDWSNLKYKLVKHYGVDARDLTEDSTVADVAALISKSLKTASALP